MLVLGQAGLVRQRVVGKHRVVAGGAGAAGVGEAGGILLCRGAQVQILLSTRKGANNEIRTKAGKEKKNVADKRANQWRRKRFSKSGDFPDDGQNVLVSLIFI